MPIPKIIHHTYKNHNLPEIYKMCQTEIKRLHPDFEYRFYTDNLIQSLENVGVGDIFMYIVLMKMHIVFLKKRDQIIMFF